MAKISIEKWEDEFYQICEDILDEEPLYPYEHLWKKGLTPKEAFKAYLEENPDYAEKLQETSTESADEKQQQEFLALAKQLEQKQKEKEIAEKLSKYCPECARVMGKKNICKCGYRRPASKKRNEDYY